VDLGVQQPSQALPTAKLDRIEYVTHCGDLLCHNGDHSIGPRCRSVCDPPRVSELAVVSVPQDRLDDLQLVWRALYEHHTALMRHLRDREVPFEQAWQSRREIERGWFASEPESFVLAAQDAGGYVGYAFVRVRPGAGFAASWRASDPLAELAILVVLPEVARAIQRITGAERVGLAVVGLEVPHAHIHLVPVNHIHDIDFRHSNPAEDDELREMAQRIREEISAGFAKGQRASSYARLCSTP
jgi:hypothetical protein